MKLKYLLGLFVLIIKKIHIKKINKRNINENNTI